MRTRREFLLLSGALLRAQQPTFSTGVRVVNVFVTVRDRSGRLVPGLKREDFQITEDGRRQEISYFSNQSDLPLTLGLLADISGSQRLVIDAQRRASLDFLRQVLRDGTDQGFVIGFDTQVDLVQPPTSSRTALEAGLSNLSVHRNAEGKLLPRAEGTVLFDAIAAATRILSGRTGRKALVILSDGVDMGSRTTLAAAIESVQRMDALVYPIDSTDALAIDAPPAVAEYRRAGKKALARIAQETGGTVIEVARVRNLEAAYRRIEEELRHQYSLGYTPATRGARYRKLRVTVNQRGLTVQARDGYFASE
jgi:VWFA-related protein